MLVSCVVFPGALAGAGDEEFGPDEWGGGVYEESYESWDEGEEGGDYDYGSVYQPKPRPDPDPAWREKAAARIERYRKGDMTVRVVDRTGKPVVDTPVRVSLVRHAFGFGTAVAAQFLVGSHPERDRYREVIRTQFNRVTLESDLKWPHWEDPENRVLALEALDWLAEQDLPVRGHCLIWGAWSFLPYDLYDLRDRPEALEDRVRRHLREQLGVLRGRLVEWDVVNEPYLCDELTHRLGKDVLVSWYRLAHALDPTARLFVNEYGVIPGYESTQQAYEDTIRFLVDAGAPLHGIGLQGHFSWTLPAPTEIYKVLDRFAAFGLPLQITECDVDLADEAVQAAYFRDLLTVFFSHPAVSDVILWGFWEGRHWRPEAALYRQDWSRKPIGDVWNDLVFEQWTTDVAGRSDGDGTFAFRGFHGRYRVTVGRGDGAWEAEVDLGEEERRATVPVRVSE